MTPAGTTAKYLERTLTIHRICRCYLCLITLYKAHTLTFCAPQDLQGEAPSLSSRPMAFKDILMAAGLMIVCWSALAAEEAAVADAGKPIEIQPRTILQTLDRYTRTAQDAVSHAFNFIGVTYHRGGTSEDTGFDCSGLVRRVFGDAFDLELPHNAKAISKMGAVVKVPDLRPGDLVFFNTLRKTFSHVGIYVGNNLFLHAPSSGGGVRLDDLRERYWVKHFDGARRIETN